MQDLARVHGWTVAQTNDQDGVAAVLEPLIQETLANSETLADPSAPEGVATGSMYQ
jgi:hypothetical protein